MHSRPAGRHDIRLTRSLAPESERVGGGSQDYILLVAPASNPPPQINGLVQPAPPPIWQDYQASNAAVTKELNLPEGVPPVDMSVIRKKSFPMDPITVEEVI